MGPTQSSAWHAPGTLNRTHMSLHHLSPPRGPEDAIPGAAGDERLLQLLRRWLGTSPATEEHRPVGASVMSQFIPRAVERSDALQLSLLRTVVLFWVGLPTQNVSCRRQRRSSKEIHHQVRKLGKRCLSKGRSRGQTHLARVGTARCRRLVSYQSSPRGQRGHRHRNAALPTPDYRYPFSSAPMMEPVTRPRRADRGGISTQQAQSASSRC